MAVDPESVQRAVEYTRRPDYPLPGLFYTPEELADLDAFDRGLFERAEALAAEAGAAVGVVSGGWRDGRRVIILPVKEEVEHYRELLRAQLDSDRVIVTTAEHSMQELQDLSDRMDQDASMLGDLGIELLNLGIGGQCVNVRYFAADREPAHRLLRERYGPAVKLKWIGPASIAEVPQTFGSWVVDETQLTVFYPLPHNGERPGSCTVEEHSDRVLVSLTIWEPRGFRTEVGGFTPSHAMIALTQPLGDRTVIDAAQNLPRPRWTGSRPRA